jgi:hypothetical protein
MFFKHQSIQVDDNHLLKVIKILIHIAYTISHSIETT